MQAVILAAGMGKRLKELQYYIDDMSKRRDGWYFISKKISEREEK